MTEIITTPITFASQGIVLKSSADEIPLTAYAALSNVFTDQENCLTPRRGYTRIGGVGAVPSGFGYLKMGTTGYRYAKAGIDWYYGAILAGGLTTYSKINPVANPMSATACPFYDCHVLGVDDPYAGQDIYEFIADGTQFLKHRPPDVLATTVGVPPTSITPSIAVAVQATIPTSIDDFEAWAGWSLSGGAGSAVAQDATVHAPGSTKSMKITGPNAAQATVRVYKTLGAGMDLGDKNSEVIQLWTYFPSDADMRGIDQIIVGFSIGDTSFATRYEKVLKMQPTQELSYIQDAQTDVGAVLDETLQDQARRVASGDAQATLIQIAPADIPPGSVAWNLIKIPKEEFSRIGTSETDNPVTWHSVKAVSIDVYFNVDGVNRIINIDDVGYVPTGKLNGTYQYLITYYDSYTDTESDIGDIVDCPWQGANNGQFLITRLDAPPATSGANWWRIYRIGGSLSQFQLVDQIPIGTLTYIDDIPDSDLGAVVLSDNQMITGIPKGITIHQHRIWAWGIPQDRQNALRFSKVNYLQTFPSDYYILVGNGAESILCCLEFDTELFVFMSGLKIYRIVGGDPGSYVAVDTNIHLGSVGPYGIVGGDSFMYLATPDGIYELPSGKRVSETINPLWHGRTIFGIPPIADGYEFNTALGFYDARLYVSYTGAGATSNNKTLVYDTLYDRWHYYEYGVKAFYREPPDFDVAQYLSISKPDMLLGGILTGPVGNYVMRLENGQVDVQSATTDPIFWGILTKELDLGAPDREKRFVDLVIDLDSQGQNVDIKAAYDGAALAAVVTISTASRDQVISPLPDAGGASEFARRIQIQLSGYTSLTATPDAQIHIYKMAPRYTPEPIKHSTYISDWSDEGTPDTKIIRELQIEYDSFNSPVTIEVQVDGAVAYTIDGTDFPNPARTANGRKKFYFALPVTADVKGSIARIKVIPVTGYVKVYWHKLLSLPEANFVTRFEGKYDLWGTIYRKRFRHIEIEIDTGGNNVTIIPWIDGIALAPSTVNTAVREAAIVSLPIDTVGTIARITIDGSSGFRPYQYQFTYIEEPLIGTIQETPWTDEQYPYDKIWKNLVLDIDTIGVAATVSFWLDGVIVQTFTVTTTTRAQVTQSLNSDTIGKLARVTVSGASTALYGVKYVADKEPVDSTHCDSYEQNFGMDTAKILKRVWWAYKAANIITCKIYADEVLMYTMTIPASLPATGYHKEYFMLPTAIKGKLFRFILDSASSFKIYWFSSETEVKAQNTQDGYVRHKFEPPSSA